MFLIIKQICIVSSMICAPEGRYGLFDFTVTEGFDSMKRHQLTPDMKDE